MVPPIETLKPQIKLQNGSAIVESIPILAVLLALGGALLLASYFLFAQTWVQFQSEQALYCLAEQQAPVSCKWNLEAKINSILPWGEVHAVLKSRSSQWEVDIQWKVGKYGFSVKRELSAQQLITKRVLL